MKQTALHSAGGPSAFTSLPDLVAVHAATRGDARALDAACGPLGYAALHARASRLAAHLARRGVGPETLVGICLDRSHEAIVAALAVWIAGGAYLPLDPAWPDERLRDLCARADLVAILTKGDHAARLAGVSAPMIALDTDAAAIAAATPIAAAQTPPEQLAYVIFTSGSTGEPKGVEISHGALAALIDWHIDAFHLTAGDRVSHLAGLGFDASVWEIWPALAAGACVVLVDEAARTDPARLHDWLIARDIAIAFAPPVLAERLLDMTWPAGTKLRTLLTGADVLHRSPPRGLPFQLVNNYGPNRPSSRPRAASSPVATSARCRRSAGRSRARPSASSIITA